jgi:uncharacterized membrane protein/nitrite reductase/ring-hydroxylating ferredoxin subunit
VPVRSTASFKGHPIHVILIPFPIAFLSGSFVADAAGLLLDHPTFQVMGGYLALAGVVMALVAAVPGAVDYFTTVPPDSSGKDRATKHALANLSAVALFVVALVVRGGIEAAPSLATLGIEAVALVLLTMGGWMGGTLAYRNQIGVDHRYAGAGKWKEIRVEGERPVVASVDELEVNQMKLVHLDDRRIVLARTEEGYVAFEDRCPHRGGSLAGGSMICGTVQCPWHGSQFDVRDGAMRDRSGRGGDQDLPRGGGGWGGQDPGLAGFSRRVTGRRAARRGEAAPSLAASRPRRRWCSRPRGGPSPGRTPRPRRRGRCGSAA